MCDVGFDEHAGNNYDEQDYFCTAGIVCHSEYQIENIDLSTELKRLWIDTARQSVKVSDFV